MHSGFETSPASNARISRRPRVWAAVGPMFGAAANFVDNAGREHFFDALIDPGVKLAAFALKQDAVSCQRVVPLRSLFRERFAGEQTNFHGADQTPPILVVDLFRAGWIERPKAPRQFRRRGSLELLAQLWIGPGQARQSMRQGFDVKTGPADDDNRLSAAKDRFRGSAKFFRIHFFSERDRADQVMRRFCERGAVGLGREQIQSAINLECVGAEDFCVEPCKQLPPRSLISRLRSGRR